MNQKSDKTILKFGLTLPGSGFAVNSPAGFSSQFTNLGSIISGFLNIAFIAAGFLMFYWLVWGVFQYIFAGGNKEGLGKARQRITWAILGFILLIFAFLVGEYVQTIFPLNNKLTPISTPEPCAAGTTWDATNQICRKIIDNPRKTTTTGTSTSTSTTTTTSSGAAPIPAPAAAAPAAAAAAAAPAAAPAAAGTTTTSGGGTKNQTIPASLKDPKPPVCSDGSEAQSCGILPTSGWTCLASDDPKRCKDSTAQGNPTCSDDHPVPGSAGFGVVAYCYVPSCPVATFPTPVEGDPSKCQK